LSFITWPRNADEQQQPLDNASAYVVEWD